MQIGIVMAVAAGGTGCTTPSTTKSGYPEVVVERAGAPEIRNAVRRIMTGRGYRLRSESPAALVFERPTGAVGREMYGSETDWPVLRVRIHTVPESTGYRLFAVGSVVTHLGPLEEEMAPDRAGTRELQNLLNSIQAEAEKAAP